MAIRDRWVCGLWSLFLGLLLLGPVLWSAPGYLLSYDMVWVPDLALRPDFLGAGSGLPRAVPSDAVVAVLDEVVPGWLLQRLVLVGALVGGGIGAASLAPESLIARLAAVGLYQWNPLVAERLLLGHWPVLVGYAVLPWVLLLARRWRETGRLPAWLLVVMPLGSLSASAGLATAVVLVAAVVGRGRRIAVAALVAAANAPWLVAGLLHASAAVTDQDGARLFALNDEGGMPGPLAALTLGGIWNSEVVPDSRTGWPGWVALVVLVSLAGLGARPWWRRNVPRDRASLLACWVVGMAIATATWAAPDAVGWLAAQVPGAGLLRDGARALVLCAPLLVALVAAGADECRRLFAAAPWGVGLAALLLPVALLPDVSWGAGLRASEYPADWADARAAVAECVADGHGGDVLVLPLSSYRAPRWTGGRKVLDPLGRYLTPDYVASDVLSVSGTVIAGEDPRVEEVAAALAGTSPAARADALAEEGIGFVAISRDAPGGDEVPEVAGESLHHSDNLDVLAIAKPVAQPTPVPDRAALTAGWVGYAVLPVLAGALAIARRRRRDT